VTWAPPLCSSQVFAPGISQDQVFEDTKHLVQSAIDGYNVCIFAYGQTGSGKTFTIYGTEREPGLTPRGVGELFRVIERDSGKYTFSVSCYMLELYQDTLADLLLPPQPKTLRPDVQRLEIKKDTKGMVSVMGATIVEVTSAKSLVDVIEKGQQRRHVASTQMNRESSRSHLIISIIIESTNLQTQSVSKGKLSFVDLAGSERCAPAGLPPTSLPAHPCPVSPPRSGGCSLAAMYWSASSLQPRVLQLCADMVQAPMHSANTRALNC
jgi:hypothetical protein